MSKYTDNVMRSVPEDVTYFGFGLRDAKKRMLGCFTYTRMARFMVREDQSGGYEIEPGDYFALRVHAARAGKPFGAWQHPRYFKTKEERDAAIAKYRVEAEKRVMRMRGTEVVS